MCRTSARHSLPCNGRASVRAGGNKGSKVLSCHGAVPGDRRAVPFCCPKAPAGREAWTCGTEHRQDTALRPRGNKQTQYMAHQEIRL
jgi:hypothetical protein